MKVIVCFVFVFFAELIKDSTQQVWLVPCDVTTDCDKIINATCSKGICDCGENFLACTCKEGYVASEDLKECVENTVVDSHCNTSEDCNQQGQNPRNRFVCANGECKCENGRCIGNGTASSTSRVKDFVVLPWFLIGFITLLCC